MTDERKPGFSDEEVERILRELDEIDRSAPDTPKVVNPKWDFPMFVKKVGRRSPEQPPRDRGTPRKAEE